MFLNQINQIGQLCLKLTQKITVAESCTGGLIACNLTELAGSSQWFDRGFITYSNEAKIDLLGVSAAQLSKYGAVSEVVAQQMALGALTNSLATISASVTGIAGPQGGSKKKPVGTVCFGFKDDTGWSKTVTQHFDGDRAQIRTQSAQFIFDQLHERLLTLQSEHFHSPLI